jgi:hypothetical protein
MLCQFENASIVFSVVGYDAFADGWNMEDAMQQIDSEKGVEWRVRNSVSTAAHLLKR